ncbi:hypothetical protein D6779_02120 [Candidatus Parcubacteria bacterium]|nr:MAG: hypothetical protein D6779_02120 [Candidatus Parcubacteria bacterium]
MLKSLYRVLEIFATLFLHNDEYWSHSSKVALFITVQLYRKPKSLLVDLGFLQYLSTQQWLSSPIYGKNTTNMKSKQTCESTGGQG